VNCALVYEPDFLRLKVLTLIMVIEYSLEKFPRRKVGIKATYE
jgi:hypothetical protein